MVSIIDKIVPVEKPIFLQHLLLVGVLVEWIFFSLVLQINNITLIKRGARFVKDNSRFFIKDVDILLFNDLLCSFA